MEINSFRLALIIIISIIVIVLIIIAFVMLYMKKLRRAKINTVIERNASINIFGQSNSLYVTTFTPNNNNNLEKTAKKKDNLSKEIKINAFCACFLRPVKYSLIKVYNESCPIDLIPFNENDEISVTKCLHAFHYNCIRKYLLENSNSNEFKCPICLSVLFELNNKI